MARKSAARRKQELETLRTGYDENIPNRAVHDWDYRFINAMLERISRGRVLSKNMRSKIDLLIDTGIKSVPTNEEASEMERLSPLLIEKRLSDALSSFAVKLRKGWSLSPAQRKFADQLIVQAREIEINGHWEPGELIREKMNLVCKLRDCYNDHFWSTHDAGAHAISTLTSYCNGEVPHISEKTWESAKHAVRGKLKLFESPKFSSGDKCIIRSGAQVDGEWVNTKNFGIICSDPRVDGRNVCYDVLYDGKCQSLSVDQINKR